jgi:transcriptional regulator with XRE-family HTH domain
MKTDLTRPGPTEGVLGDAAELGNVVAARRRTLGLTLGDAAGRLGVAATALHRLEHGQGGMSVARVLTTLQSLGIDLVARTRDGGPLWTPAAAAQRVRPKHR